MAVEMYDNGYSNHGIQEEEKEKIRGHRNIYPTSKRNCSDLFPYVRSHLLELLPLSITVQITIGKISTYGPWQTFYTYD